MDIHSSLAAEQYAATRPITAPKPVSDGQGAEIDFAKFATEFANTLQNSENVAKAAMTGDADPHALVQALAQTELAIETAVTVRDKVVEAYQEILRMPV